MKIATQLKIGDTGYIEAENKTEWKSCEVVIVLDITVKISDLTIIYTVKNANEEIKIIPEEKIFVAPYYVPLSQKEFKLNKICYQLKVLFEEMPEDYYSPDPEVRKILNGLKRIKNLRNKNLSAATKYYSDPKNQEKKRQYMKEYCSRPEVKEKNRQRQKEYYHAKKLKKQLEKTNLD